MPTKQDKGRIQLVEIYGECERCWCGDADPDKQAQFRCSSPYFDEVQWEEDGNVPAMWMGLPSSAEDDQPIETFDDGCPGGWYRCEFMLSLHKYLGDNNPLLRECQDRIVQEAVVYYQGQCARARELLNG